MRRTAAPEKNPWKHEIFSDDLTGAFSQDDHDRALLRVCLHCRRRAGDGALSTKRRIGAAILIVLLLAAAYLVLSRTDALAVLLDEQKLHALVRECGWCGSLVITGLMAAAIVLSPLPSAPIALAAGMAYGHFWGTVFVVMGAEIGALIAFGIGRLLGYDALQQWFGKRLQTVRIFGSQNLMTAIVFASRLLPFISFDVVSYAAGLTPLKLWRFALATLAGVIPVSFLLAHFGSEVASRESGRILATALLLGLVTLLPLLGKWLWTRLRSGGRR